MIEGVGRGRWSSSDESVIKYTRSVLIVVRVDDWPSGEVICQDVAEIKRDKCESGTVMVRMWEREPHAAKSGF